MDPLNPENWTQAPKLVPKRHAVHTVETGILGPLPRYLLYRTCGCGMRLFRTLDVRVCLGASPPVYVSHKRHKSQHAE
jgi:hypothetical protein